MVDTVIDRPDGHAGALEAVLSTATAAPRLGSGTSSWIETETIIDGSMAQLQLMLLPSFRSTLRIGPG
jgi:hypothetical protein